jgi:hypothetical protein
MSILLLDQRPISGHNTDFADFYMATVYNDYEDLFLENRLECEIIAWKNITNKVANSHATKPRLLVNLLVILAKTLVHLLVKLTKLG